MCGIAGLVDLQRRFEPDLLRNIASRMADTLRHRGPDDRGVWIDSAAGVALGHTRLAIIDFEPSWFLSTFFPVTDVPSNRGGHGVRPDIVIQEVTQAGFALLTRIDDWPRGQYCLIFRRP